MTTRVTEDFNRANGGLGANWTTTTGANALAIDTNQVKAGTGASDCWQFYSGVTWANDQWAQLTITALNAGAFDGGPVVRMSAAFNGYQAQSHDGTHLYVYKVTGGSFVELTSVIYTPTVNDVIYLEIQGNTLIVKINGVTQITITDNTSPFTTGNAGAGLFDGTIRGDDFIAGDFAVGPTITSQPQGSASIVGATTTYSVTATGGTIAYQWQYSTNGGEAWANASGGSGADTATYTTPPAVAGMNGWMYRCALTDVSGTSNTLGAYFFVGGLSNTGRGRRLPTSGWFARTENKGGLRTGANPNLLRKNSIKSGGEGYDADITSAWADWFIAPAPFVPDPARDPMPIVGTRRNRPGHGPYSTGKYFRPDTRFFGDPTVVQTPIALAADLAGRVAVAATLSTSIPLASAQVAQGTLSAALTTQIPLASSAQATAALTAALTTTIALAASCAGKAASTAALSTAIPLAAAAAGQATLLGTLSAASVALAADAAARSSASAALSTTIALASAAAAGATLNAALSTAIALAADQQAKAALTVAASTAIALAATCAGKAAVSAALSTAIPLAADAGAKAALVGTLQGTAGATLTADAAGRAVATAALSTSIPLAAASAAQATLSAALNATPVALAADAQAKSVVTAAVTTAIALVAVCAGKSAATATLGTAIPLASDGAARSSVTAALDVGAVSLSATCSGRAAMSATLVTSIALAQVAAAKASVSVALSTGIALAAIARAQATMSATLIPPILSDDYRYDVPAGSWRYDVAAGSWRYDIPSMATP